MSARSPSPVRACALRRPSRLDLTVAARMLSSDPCSRSFSNCSASAASTAAAARRRRSLRRRRNGLLDGLLGRRRSRDRGNGRRAANGWRRGLGRRRRRNRRRLAGRLRFSRRRRRRWFGWRLLGWRRYRGSRRAFGGRTAELRNLRYGGNDHRYGGERPQGDIQSAVAARRGRRRRDKRNRRRGGCRHGNRRRRNGRRKPSHAQKGRSKRVRGLETLCRIFLQGHENDLAERGRQLGST